LAEKSGEEIACLAGTVWTAVRVAGLRWPAAVGKVVL